MMKKKTYRGLETRLTRLKPHVVLVLILPLPPSSLFVVLTFILGLAAVWMRRGGGVRVI